MRQIVLDTETTGLSPQQGHRIIEIGCVEIIDRKLTGNHYHCYINPEREVDPGAIKVHGITNEFLQNKPLFSEVIEEFMAFVNGGELLIHNAPFDVGFINWEIKLYGAKYKRIESYCTITDTLAMARKKHVGQRNSLDALCKRYDVNNSNRTYHGALLDAELLADVYLAMTGGQHSLFGDAITDAPIIPVAKQVITEKLEASTKLKVIKATPEENQAHEEYLKKMKEKGSCVWLDD